MYCLQQSLHANFNHNFSAKPTTHSTRNRQLYFIHICFLNTAEERRGWNAWSAVLVLLFTFLIRIVQTVLLRIIEQLAATVAIGTPPRFLQKLSYFRACRSVDQVQEVPGSNPTPSKWCIACFCHIVFVYYYVSNPTCFHSLLLTITFTFLSMKFPPSMFDSYL